MMKILTLLSVLFFLSSCRPTTDVKPDPGADKGHVENATENRGE